MALHASVRERDVGLERSHCETHDLRESVDISVLCEQTIGSQRRYKCMCPSASPSVTVNVGVGLHIDVHPDAAAVDANNVDLVATCAATRSGKPGAARCRSDHVPLLQQVEGQATRPCSDQASPSFRAHETTCFENAVCGIHDANESVERCACFCVVAELYV